MANNLKAGNPSKVDQAQETGPWDAALTTLIDWDPAWAATCVKMTTNPWDTGVLPRKFIELVGIGLNAACTNLNPDGTRRHIRAALAAGATREEILFVLKCGALMSIHSCSLGAPILLACWRRRRDAGQRSPRHRLRDTPTPSQP
jgi:alkylhydroperoxidase/carboxymuconolactone decarboxylase family protein YurZ